MKQNVDLTADRMFSSLPHIPFWNRFRFYEPFRFWNYETMQVVHSNSDLSNYSSSLVLIGNATQRQAQRFRIRLDYGSNCECCGADLEAKPWDKHYCLCGKCADNLSISCQKLWKFRDDPIRDSHDRIVVEMNRR